MKRNPATSYDPRAEESNRNSKKLLFAKGRVDFKPRGCVYCGDLGHKDTQCDKIVETTEQKRILAKKGLCFNCARKMHRASECASKSSCSHCNKRHHTSICEQANDKRNETPANDEQHTDHQRPNGKKLLTDGGSGDGIFPVVAVKVNGITCHALIDSGAGSSYASAKLIKMLNIKPSEIKRQHIDMLMSTRTSQMEFYDAKVSAVDESYKMNVKLTKVEKGELLSISNPEYTKLIDRYQHLDPVQMDDSDMKQQLPVHIILSSGEYTRVKTDTKPLVGGDGEPVAERTKLGWFIMSPGAEFNKGTMLLTQTSQADFETLCRLDVLGLADTLENDQDTVYQDFKEQLVRKPEG